MPGPATDLKLGEVAGPSVHLSVEHHLDPADERP
ncbi:hypothetical protein QE449_003327 [Rhodococcus sp. SORGH_AS303]|nr:hypothetical protein [Rhodococcus sp. SORGH_AS_0303]